MTSVIEPNIFDFATGELSQDAFICWLLSWIKCSPDSSEADAAREFLVSLYNSCRDEGLAPSEYRDKVLTPEDVESVEIVRQKKHKIDVYLEVKFNSFDNSVPFIIEDKVWTSPHSNQLEAYKQKIKNENRSPFCVFYKTGFLYKDKDEAKAASAGYYIINAKWMVNLLFRHDSNHPFYLDYIDYLNTRFVAPFESAISEVLSEGGHEYLRTGYKQYILMDKLTNNMERIIYGSWNQTVDPGSNNGGTPWTAFRFMQLTNIFGGKNESLNYRIDYRSKGKKKGQSPYFRVTHYANYKDRPDLKDFKAKRRGEYSSLYSEAMQSIKSGLKLGKRSNRNGYESEVAIFFLDDPENSIPKLIEYIPKIHEKFISLLNNSVLIKNQ
ncbi:MAG: PD-(D/E)XK nuclease family protein [Desulfuromusa sp.]|nr:PD-(D/E)XK nuclease family protein [Desulfuromusa sp.]